MELWPGLEEMFPEASKGPCKAVKETEKQKAVRLAFKGHDFHELLPGTFMLG